MNNFIRMLFIALFVIAPILTNKIALIFGFTVPVGQIFVSLFMLGCIDLMNHREGLKDTRAMIANGVAVKLIIYLVVIPIAIALPSAPFWHGQEMYAKMLGESVRYMLASELIMFVGQYIFDAKIFDLFKKRNWFVKVIASDLVSQTLQTAGFVILSFWGTGKPLLFIFVSTLVFTLILSVVKSVLLYPLTLKRK